MSDGRKKKSFETVKLFTALAAVPISEAMAAVSMACMSELDIVT